MARQTFDGPVRWIIVDDGKTPQTVNFFREGWLMEFIRPLPCWRPGQNTQARNLLAGMERVGDDNKLVVIEDDDHYAHGYLADVDAWLDRADLVGETRARYFNVPTGIAFQHENKEHCSLCSTAMKGPGIAAFRKAVGKNKKFIDMELWRDFKGTKYLCDSKHVIGIKGLPGRGGIGHGHRMTGKATSGLLREWIGEDAAIYGY
jgi:hypothetical protein